MNGFCQKIFFLESNEVIIWSFFFQFVHTVDYINKFSYVEPSVHLCDEAYMIMVNDYFLMYF